MGRYKAPDALHCHTGSTATLPSARSDKQIASYIPLPHTRFQGCGGTCAYKSPHISSYSNSILINEQAVRGLVLLYAAEAVTLHWKIIVCIIVVHLGYLTDKQISSTRFGKKSVINARLKGDAVSRCYLDRFTGGGCVILTVTQNAHGYGEIGHTVLTSYSKLTAEDAARAIYNILCFIKVVVKRNVLLTAVL